MEANEIQKALQSITSIGKIWDSNDLMIFLQKVLGYTLNDDLILTKLNPPLQSDKKVKINPKIKFVTTLPPSNNLPEDQQKKWVLGLALEAATNIVMLPQADKILFYSVDWEDDWQMDILVEVDLARDDPEDIAQQLWALAKKDCGRKILVGI